MLGLALGSWTESGLIPLSFHNTITIFLEVLFGVLSGIGTRILWLR